MVLVALAACGALIGNSSKSFWDDEAFSFEASRLSWSDLYEFSVHRDPHTAFWNAMLHVWRAVGGDSAIWVRSLSAVFAVLTVVGVLRLSRLIFDERGALVSGILFTASETYLLFSQEARPGMLSACATTWSVLTVVRALDTRSTKRWIAAGVLAALAVYGHPFAFFALAGAGVPLLVMRRKDIAVRGFVSGVAVFAILSSPLLVVLVQLRGNDNISWIPPLGPHTIGSGFFLLGGNGTYVTAAIVLAFAFGYFVRSAALLIRHDEHAWRGAMITAWALCLPAALIVLSFATPTYVARYLVPSFPAFAIAAAGGVLWLFDRRIRAASVATVLTFAVVCAVSVTHWYVGYQKDDWKSATKFVESDARVGDGVAVAGHRAVFDFYLPEKDFTVLQPVTPARPWGSPLPAFEDLREPDVAATSDGRIWYLHLTRDAQDPTLTQALRSRFGAPQSRTFDDVVVDLYGGQSR